MREHLYRALSTELGILLETDDVDRCIQKLQEERRKSGDEALKVLTIMRGRDRDNTVWIAKAPQSTDESDAEEA